MRFTLPPKPNDRDKRILKRFALFPVKINHQYVWLETYWTLQVYRVYASPHRSGWITVRKTTNGLDVEASSWRTT